MNFPGRHRPLLILSLIALTVSAVSLSVGTRLLRGSVQSEIAREDRIVSITDRDGDSVMTPREMRRSLSQAIRKLGQSDTAYDLDDNGSADRGDVRILIGVLRSFLGAVCGNTVRDAGEQCDDGNRDTTDVCTNACKDPVCGDGSRWNGREQCDDGNSEERDHCSKLCVKTNNWWIDELAIPGPISPLPADPMEVVPGIRIVTPLGEVVQFWFTEWRSSSQVFGQENVSVYRPVSGWSEAKNLFREVFPEGAIEGFGPYEYAKRAVFDREGRVFMFYTTGWKTADGNYMDVGFGRATYDNGVWHGEKLLRLGVTGGDVIGWRIDEDNRGLVLFSALTNITSDLQNHPKLSGYKYDQGLFAVAYNDGIWGQPQLVKSLYHTTAWQNAAQNNRTLGRIDYPPILARNGTSYTIQWFDNVTFDIGVAP